MSTAATLSSTSDSVVGMAMFGKTAVALLVVLSLIFACSWVLRRLNSTGLRTGKTVQVISSTPLGQRERVVVVQVQDQWLVLGVTAQQITKLHELPAEVQAPAPTVDASASFSERFAQALRQNLSGRRTRRDNPPA